jgi:hypothetical protein
MLVSGLSQFILANKLQDRIDNEYNGKRWERSEVHTLDEGLGEDACSVTVTAGCTDEAGAVLCVVTTVNTVGVGCEDSGSEVIGGDDGNPGNV